MMKRILALCTAFILLLTVAYAEGIEPDADEAAPTPGSDASQPAEEAPSGYPSVPSRGGGTYCGGEITLTCLNEEQLVYSSACHIRLTEATPKVTFRWDGPSGDSVKVYLDGKVLYYTNNQDHIIQLNLGWDFDFTTTHRVDVKSTYSDPEYDVEITYEGWIRFAIGISTSGGRGGFGSRSSNAIIPGKPLTTDHEGGRGEILPYFVPAPVISSELQEKLLLDGKALDVTLEGSTASFLTSIAGNVITLTPKNYRTGRNYIFHLSGEALEILYRSGISGVDVVTGVGIYSISTRPALCGADYEQLRISGSPVRMWQWTVSSSGIQMEADGSFFDVNEEGLLEKVR